LREAAEQDDPAPSSISACVRNGQGGAKLRRAIKWYSRSGGTRHPAAQFNLGVFYERPGRPQDSKKAVEWYYAAAEQECARQCNLGLCYQTGRASRKQAEAVRWFHRAARQGRQTAQHISDCTSRPSSEGGSRHRSRKKPFAVTWSVAWFWSAGTVRPERTSAPNCRDGARRSGQRASPRVASARPPSIVSPAKSQPSASDLLFPRQ